jgi:Leucine-rich repeat (LRR) protein
MKLIEYSSVFILLLTISCAGKNDTSNTTNFDTKKEVKDEQYFIEGMPLDTLYKDANGIYERAEILNSSNAGYINNAERFKPISIRNNLNESDKPEYSLNVSFNFKNSDPQCSNIFSYDDEKRQININAESITKYTQCNMHIKVSGTNKKTGEVKDFVDDTFNFNFNLTMYQYYSNNDENYKKFVNSDLSIEKFSNIFTEIKEKGILKLENSELDNIDFLEFVYDLVHEFHFKNAKLKDYSILKKFNNLKKISFDSSLKQDELDHHLSLIPQVESLAFENSNLQDLTPIIKNHPNLKEINLSGNHDIKNLSLVKELKNLQKIELRRTNLSTLEALNNATQILDLDISENPLRKFTDKDRVYLVSLINLEALNVSVNRKDQNSTAITDEVLNNYFRNVYEDTKLKKFVDRNEWGFASIDCSNTNDFSSKVGLIRLMQFEYLDVHGNGCRDLDFLGKPKGFDRSSLINFKKLKYLNVSDTSLQDFDFFPQPYALFLKDIKIIFNENPEDKYKSILVSKARCEGLFRDLPEHIQECEGLKDYKKLFNRED